MLKVIFFEHALNQQAFLFSPSQLIIPQMVSNSINISILGSIFQTYWYPTLSHLISGSDPLIIHHLTDF